MNKHGQTLVLFIILIPIVIMLLAIIVDVGVVISKKSHLNEVTKMVIKEVIDDNNSYENALKLFIKNDVNIDNIKINKVNDTLEIKNEIQVNSIFGSVIGIHKYDIKIEIKGVKKNNKIVFE